MFVAAALVNRPENVTRNYLTNSVALVRERTIPTERPPLVGEVSANFADNGMSRGQRGGSLRPYSLLSRPDSRTLAHNTSPEESQKLLHWNTRAKYTTLEHSHEILHENTRAKHFTRTLARITSLEHSHEVFH
jgi:hypothetical protein